jgi:hypothetical protein
MFGRRRPVLGAAVVYGASKSAARHEAEKQGQRNAEMQMAAERGADKKRREEEERDRRTQLAIDEALAKERSKNEQKLAVDAAVARERSRSLAAATGGGIADHTATEHAPPSYTQGVDGKSGEKLRYCPNCGHKCNREAKFCAECGQKQATDD